MLNLTQKKRLQTDNGFTLVELMIALAVGGIVMAAVMTSFLSQHNVYLAQDEVVEMQQNARVVLDMLTRDIRTAGYNPSGKANAGIVTFTQGRLGFTQDLDGNGTLDITPKTTVEVITYGFASAYDADTNGIVDANGASAPLGRNTGTATGLEDASHAFDPVANNFRAIEFRYLDGAGLVTTTASDIRSIQVSILVQAAHPDTKTPVPSRAYTTPSGATWDSTAGYRSRYFTTTIQCRNLGL